MKYEHCHKCEYKKVIDSNIQLNSTRYYMLQCIYNNIIIAKKKYGLEGHN